MDKIKAIDKVRQFRTYGGNPIPDVPTLITQGRADARAAFVESEMLEFRAAVRDGDLIGAFDALIDALYFIYDGALELGATHLLFREFFDEVHAANMSKFCATEEEAFESQAAYLDGTHPHNTGNEQYCPGIKRVGDMWAVYDVQTKKTLKSINTRKPDLEAILYRHFPQLKK